MAAVLVFTVKLNNKKKGGLFMSGELVAAILIGIWLFAAGFTYHVALKHEYEKYGIPDWRKK